MNRLDARGIEPSTANLDVMTTVDGEASWAPVAVAGAIRDTFTITAEDGIETFELTATPASAPVLHWGTLFQPPTPASYTIDGNAITLAGGAKPGDLITVDYLVGSATPDDPVLVHMIGSDFVHPNDAGMDYLADQYQAALAAAGATPAPGTNLYAYGDSWTATDTVNTPGRRAVVQLASRLGLTLTNRAVGGDSAADSAMRAVGLNPFVAGTAGTVLLAVGLNDLGPADTPAKRAMVEHNLRSLFSAVCAAERIEQTANTGAAGWTTNTLSQFSGGTHLTTPVAGATMTFDIATAGDYYLHSYVTDGVNLIGGVLAVSQGGATLASLDLNGKHVDPINTGSPHYSTAAFKIPGVVPGTLTVTFSTAGRSSANGWVDCLTRKSATPPRVLGVKPVEVPLYAPYSGKPELLAYIRGLYDVMAAEFGSSVVVCDPAPGWTP